MGAVIAGALIVGGAAVYGASQSNKAAKSIANNQRDPGSEMDALMGYAPDALNLGLEYDRYAGEQQLDLMGDFFRAAMDRYPEVARREREATSDQRAWDARDLGKSGAKMQSTLEGMAPELRAGSGAILKLLGNVGETTPLLADLNAQARGEGVSEINNRLEDYAMGQLALGGALSADEQRKITQDSRAAFSERGLYGSDMSLVDEVLNLDSARRGRERERVGVASAINAGILGEQAQDRGFETSVEELNQRRLGLDRAFVPAAIGAGNARLAPMLSLFNQRAAVNPLSAASIMAAAPNAIGASNHVLHDVLGYGQDANDTNFNAREARGITQMNNGAAIAGAGIQAGSSVASAGYKRNATR